MDNTNKNPIFSIKNFRSFGEDGADFELAPITVLTGCNSAGKSSLVKALMLLAEQSNEQFTESQRADRGYGIEEPVGIDLPVHNKQYRLGNINNVIYSNAKDPKLEFSYTLKSETLGDYVRVTKRFRPAESKIMAYGYLAGVKVETIDGKTLYSCDEFVEEGDIADKEPLSALFSSFLSELHANQAYDHPLVKMLQEKYTETDYKNKKDEFYKEVLVEVPFLSEINYIDSSPAPIKRLYTIDDSDKLSSALWNAYEKARDISLYAKTFDLPEDTIIPMAFTNTWIRKFEIGESVNIQSSEDGNGISLRLRKNKEEENSRLLADEGYGITQLFTLLLQIDNCMLGSEKVYKKKEHWICVEEPEVHLHPKYQSLLANMFVEAYQKYNIRFIIETHSEYLIRKLQVMVADKNCPLQPNDISLNYINKDDSGLSHNNQIEIHEDGGLNASLFGNGFFDESNNLALDLFRLKPILL